MAVQIADGSLDKGGACLEASDGTKLAVIWDGLNPGSIEIWSDIDGTPNLEDSDTASVVFGGGSIAWVHAAIDSGDDIHIIASCTSEQTRDVSYGVATESAGSWTLGSWQQALNYTEASPIYPGCFITIDSNDIPHILAVNRVKQSGSTQDNTYYNNRIGGSWNTPEKVGTRATKTDAYHAPVLAHRNSNILEALYLFSTTNDPAYKSAPAGGGFGSESTYSRIVHNDARLSMISLAGTPSYFYVSDNVNVYRDDTDSGYDANGTYDSVSAGHDNPYNYIFYIDSDYDVHLVSYNWVSTDWADEGAIQTGTYVKVITNWSYLNYNTSDELIYIFDDGTDIYYDSFTLAAAGGTPIPTITSRLRKRSSVLIRR